MAQNRGGPCFLQPLKVNSWRTFSAMRINKPANQAFCAIFWDKSECVQLKRTHSYIVLIGPGYCDIRESVVNNVIPSTVACANKTLSNGSLCIGGKLSMATT